ncbi:MAG TPA: PaaX family transcriptional regulator C-terminal domain-containing protein [Streptosporangiaceae bacterium]
MTDVMEPPEERGRRPRSLIVTFYGAYGRELGGWISVADLIGLMSELDVDSPAVRSAVSRLKRRGLLEARRIGGTAGYSLSDEARRILAEGDRRIFGRRVADVADGWVMVVFSVPESQRHKRHLLRSRLRWMGFGTAAPGVWIAPLRLADEARRALERLEVAAYVELFRADHLAFHDLRHAIARWWDLDALRTMYDEFLLAHEPLLARWSRRRSAGGDEAFADYLRTVDAWRRMPYLDPGLPLELMPDDWSGNRAAHVFFELHARLREPGLRHAIDIVSSPQPARP